MSAPVVLTQDQAVIAAIRHVVRTGGETLVGWACFDPAVEFEATLLSYGFAIVPAAHALPELGVS